MTSGKIWNGKTKDKRIAIQKKNCAACLQRIFIARNKQKYKYKSCSSYPNVSSFSDFKKKQTSVIKRKWSKRKDGKYVHWTVLWCDFSFSKWNEMKHFHFEDERHKSFKQPNKYVIHITIIFYDLNQIWFLDDIETKKRITSTIQWNTYLFWHG